MLALGGLVSFKNILNHLKIARKVHLKMKKY